MSKKLIVDNSILQAWVTCRLMATMRYTFHFVPKDTAPPLEAGRWVHIAMAHWLDSEGKDVPGALARFTKGYKPWAAKHVNPADRLAYTNVYPILENWFARNERKWPFQHQPGLVEVALQYDLTNHITMVGVMDAMRVRKLGRGRYGIDHKTSGQINQWWKDGQRFTSQYNGYDTMLWKLGYDDLAGWYVNGIALSELNSSDKACPTHKMPYKKCRLAPEHLRHEMLLLTKTDGSRTDWLRTATEHAEDFALQKERITHVDQLRELPKDGLFNRQSPCVRCDYREWCHVAGRSPHRLKEYDVVPWNPLDHIGNLKEPVA